MVIPAAFCHSGFSGRQCGLRRRESASPNSLALGAGRWPQDSIPTVLGPDGLVAWSGSRMGLGAHRQSGSLRPRGGARAWQLGHFPGPQSSSQGWHALSCPLGVRGGGALVTLLAWLSRGTELALPLPLQAAGPSRGGTRMGLLGTRPGFSLVPLGKDPEKGSTCPSGEGGGRVGPGPAQWSGEAPGALGSHKVPPQPRQRLCSRWL